METLTVRKLQKLLRYDNDVIHPGNLEPLGFHWVITLKTPKKDGVIFVKYRVPRIIAELLCAAYHLGRINQQKAIQKELGL